MKKNEKESNELITAQLAKKRIKWIDCAKAVAIMAVLVDHNKGFLYTNQDIARSSYFSVCLFILLSGITAFNTTTVVRGGGEHKNYRSIGRLLGQYAIATFILQVWYTRFFDLQIYVSHLLHFDIQAPYYFILFFLQIKLISPFLILWCVFCDKQKMNFIWHFITLVFLCWFCSILIRYTFILQVHGGGKNLFGGTFLLLYYIGILLANFKVFEIFNSKRVVILPVAVILWSIWWRLSCMGKLPFDTMLAKYWGDGFNPPGVNFIVFSIITLFVCYAAFSLMEDNVNQMGKTIVDGFTFIGQYTLYIFMYHLLVRDVILTFWPAAVEANIWLKRFVIFIPMLIVPALLVWLIKKSKNRFMQDCFKD